MNINNIKKIIVALLVGAMLVVNNVTFVIAQEAPAPPTPPTAPTAPTNDATTPTPPTAPTNDATPPTPPTAPTNDATAPTPPTAPVAPTPPTAPAQPVNTNTAVNADNTQNETIPAETVSTNTTKKKNPAVQNGTQENASSPPSTNSTPVTDNGTGNQNQNGSTSGASILTGDATTNGVIKTNANDNLSGKSAGVVDGGGVNVVNGGNAGETNNSGSATIVNGSSTSQDNSANVVNDMNLSTTTGKNSASLGIGDASILTGNANTTGTMITLVNTNLDGVAAYEFNIVDDHTGDYILDFSAANCVSGCAGGTKVANTGNGPGSVNDSTASILTNDETFQNNDANLENNMVLMADSGNNKANYNTVGDTYITTGDANVNANVLNFANNNIAGGVIYGVVNVFGDLVGDIVFPGEVCCFGNTLASNSNNGANSINTANVNLTDNNTTSQFNEAVIDNNLVFDANSGDNRMSQNNQGDNSIKTGNTSVDAKVLNIANTNISGGDYWLVLVNQAGKWLGQIIGADGKNYSGSEGLEFIVGDDGQITVANSGNAPGSTNTANLNIENNSNIEQNNKAHVVNNIELYANSGKNSANGNNMGSNYVQTGDASVLANIVNFVNNNITGGGRLFVNVINVFGSWKGNFRGPGYERQLAEAGESKSQNIGGVLGSDGENNSNSQSSSQTAVLGTSTSANTQSEIGAAIITRKGRTVSITPTISSRTYGAGDKLASAGIIDQIDGISGLSIEQESGFNAFWLLVIIPGLFILVGVSRKVIAFAKVNK